MNIKTLDVYFLPIRDRDVINQQIAAHSLGCYVHIIVPLQ